MASFVKTDVAFFFSNNEACCTFMCATPRCMSCRTNIVMSVLNTRNSYSYFWTKSLKHNVKCKSPVFIVVSSLHTCGRGSKSDEGNKGPEIQVTSLSKLTLCLQMIQQFISDEGWRRFFLLRKSVSDQEKVLLFCKPKTRSKANNSRKKRQQKMKMGEQNRKWLENLFSNTGTIRFLYHCKLDRKH